MDGFAIEGRRLCVLMPKRPPNRIRNVPNDNLQAITLTILFAYFQIQYLGWLHVLHLYTVTIEL